MAMGALISSSETKQGWSRLAGSIHSSETIWSHFWEWKITCTYSDFWNLFTCLVWNQCCDTKMMTPHPQRGHRPAGRQRSQRVGPAQSSWCYGSSQEGRTVLPGGRGGHGDKCWAHGLSGSRSSLEAGRGRVGGGEQKHGRRRVQEPSWEGLDRSCLGFLNSVLYIMMRGPYSSFSIKVTKSDLHFRKLISRTPVMEEIFTYWGTGKSFWLIHHLTRILC